MPEQKTLERVRKDKRQGKSASTQAGEFVRQEMEHIREGKHGARSTKQAIAIGLSEARRAGVRVPPPLKKGSQNGSSRTRSAALTSASSSHKKPDPRRSAATLKALKREGTSAASHAAISRQTKSQARQRTAAERSASARKAARSRTASISR